VKQIRKRLTYANVMSSLAVFLVLGGATAFAATELANNSVGTQQLKKNAVTTAKIKKEAVAAGKIKNGAVGNAKLGNGSVSSEKLADASVTGPKIAAAAVNGDKVQDGSLTGTDINQGTLNQVKAANVYGVMYQEVGGPKIISATDPGIKSGGCFLVCSVEFPRNVTQCTTTVSGIDQGSGSGEPAIFEAFGGSDPKTILVVAWDDAGGLIAHDFGMTVVCPTAI
jgi:hypothetical protein